MQLLKRLQTQSRYFKTQTNQNRFHLLSIDKNGTVRNLGEYPEENEPLRKIQMLKLRNEQKKHDATYIIRKEDSNKFYRF
jgi:hypothetical protein